MEDAPILLLKEDECLSWRPLYEKYSGMMYGAILRFTNDRNLADKILSKIFLRISKENCISDNSKPLYLKLLHFTCATAKEFLIRHKPISTTKPAGQFPVLDSLLFEALSFKDAAAQHSLTDEACRKKLHLEVTQMRRQLKQQQVDGRLELS